MHIVVIAVQNSLVNKKTRELNFDINNTFATDWCHVEMLWSMSLLHVVLARIKPVHSSSLPRAKPFYKPLSNEAVYLSTRTELNHRNYIVYSV